MWDCEAYGPEGTQHGVLCFFARAGERVCVDQLACHEAMRAERGRAFQVIQEGAAKGISDMEYLEKAFTSPAQLLGGGEGAIGDEDAEEVDVEAVVEELRAILGTMPDAADDPQKTEQRWRQFKEMAARIESDPVLRAELDQKVAEIEAELAKDFPPEDQ